MVRSKVHYNLWTKLIVWFWVLENPLKNQTKPNLTIPTSESLAINQLLKPAQSHQDQRLQTASYPDIAWDLLMLLPDWESNAQWLLPNTNLLLLMQH